MTTSRYQLQYSQPVLPVDQNLTETPDPDLKAVRITIISRAGVGGMKAEIGSDQSNNQELSFSLIRNKYYRLAALTVHFYSSSFGGLTQEQ